MAHPFHGHREMHVGHRRAKTLMKSGGYAGGMSDKAVEGFAKRLAKHERAEISEEKHEGEYARGGRLDKRARGGATGHLAGCTCAACGGKVEKRARGGGIHQITPSKRKPHTNINIVNVSHRPRPAGIRPLPAIPAAGAGLPVPPVAGPGLPLRPPGMAKGGRMRTGKKYGEGSGEGRLEEFKHMKSK